MLHRAGRRFFSDFIILNNRHGTRPMEHMRLLVAIMLLLTPLILPGATNSLESILAPIRDTNQFPAMGAAVVVGDQPAVIQVIGHRKADNPTPVTETDQWHIGSCTKSMTASLAAMLVEEGKLRWDMTLPELFPALASDMNPEWKTATLEQLLCNHGGVPTDLNENGLWSRLWDRADKPPIEQRAYLARELLTHQKPAAPPGSKYIYSNAGFALVGHAIELQLGIPWEQALTERLFKPLGMDSAGFGAPASLGKIDQPWGHNGKDFIPVPPGPGSDNPAAIGPGATVHCSLSDLAKYATWHLNGARGKATLLKPETFKRLHTAFGQDNYAMGWIVTWRSWGGSNILTHTGSNNMFYTVIWIAPEKNFAVIVCTNVGMNYAGVGCNLAVARIINRYLK
jgi:CubicO group peptidase (beta-lactamase class C family)